MFRVTATVGMVFALGAGVMAVLGAWLGGSAEAASLGVVGGGLVGTSYLLGGRVGAAQAPSEERRRGLQQQTRTA